MPATISYHQNCPVCGRMLRIGVTLLGRRVYCQHCGGGFVAADLSMRGDPARDPADRKEAKVDNLLERAAVMLGRAAR